MEATLLLSPEDKVREEENRPEDLSAQPTSAPDKSSNAVPIEAEATAETQQQIDVRGVESASALTDVKTDHQSLASEEEGPPGDDGPPGGEFYDTLTVMKAITCSHKCWHTAHLPVDDGSLDAAVIKTLCQ